jgi:hypothetical protein
VEAFESSRNAVRLRLGAVGTLGDNTSKKSCGLNRQGEVVLQTALLY